MPHNLSDLIGGDEGDRTPDLMNAIHALSQLSYVPWTFRRRSAANNEFNENIRAGQGGIKDATERFTSQFLRNN